MGVTVEVKASVMLHFTIPTLVKKNNKPFLFKKNNVILQLENNAQIIIN